MTEIFILTSPEAPWGDYGSILFYGMTTHLPRKKGLLQLERAGPFVPPLFESGVGDICVTDSFRKELDKSGLSGCSFLNVIKKRIVEIHWETWDKRKPEPKDYPDSGEPEDYVLSRPHSQRIADAIGKYLGASGHRQG